MAFYETKTHINVFMFLFLVCLVNCPTALAGNSDVCHYLLFMDDSKCTRLNLPSRLLLQKTDIMVSAMLHTLSLCCILWCSMRTTLASVRESWHQMMRWHNVCFNSYLFYRVFTFTSHRAAKLLVVFVLSLLRIVLSVVGIYYFVWNTKLFKTCFLRFIAQFFCYVVKFPRFFTIYSQIRNTIVQLIKFIILYATILKCVLRFLRKLWQINTTFDRSLIIKIILFDFISFAYEYLNIPISSY